MINPWKARIKKLVGEFVQENFYSEAGRQRRTEEIIKELEGLDKKLNENAQNRAWEEVFAIRNKKKGYTGGKSANNRVRVSANRNIGMKTSIQRIKELRRLRAKTLTIKRKLRKVGLFRVKKK